MPRKKVSNRRVTLYRGAQKPATRVQEFDITLPADDTDAVQCATCGAYVKKLSRGQPRAHAAGGLLTNTRAGRYACEGSGTLA